MTVARFATVAALLTCIAMPAAAQAPVSIQFPQAGYVTLTARNAPLRTILSEWARVGGSRFVNAERVTGAPLTLELVNVPEKKALETILRGVSGYIVGARAKTLPGTSSFDRIMIVPQSAPIRQVASAPPTFTPTPTASPFVPSEPDADQGQGQGAAARNPTLLQQQLREASERAEAARQNREAAQDPDEDEEPAPRAPAARPGANPFGNIQGSSRPGEVTPAPRRNNNQPREDD